MRVGLGGKLGKIVIRKPRVRDLSVEKKKDTDYQPSARFGISNSIKCTSFPLKFLLAGLILPHYSFN